MYIGQRIRVLSILMAALLTFSLFPTTALSAGPEDSVIYNLGSRNVTVDYDSSAEETANHKIFNDDGSYTIQLEDNAFFPYEVQFSTASGSSLSVETFDTPESTVNVGGHEFSVFTNVTDENTLSQIGFKIGDEYIPAVPDPKTFIPAPRLRSLLPITTVNLTADFSGYLPGELKRILLSTVLSAVSPSQSIGDSDKVVWVKKVLSNDDSFSLVNQGDFIDLSPDQSTSTLTIELIVGSALQLDVNNIKYTVQIITTSFDDLLNLELYTQDGSERSAVNSEPFSFYPDNDYWHINLALAPQYSNTAQYFLGMAFASNSSDVDVKVYKGLYKTLDEAIAANNEVTSSVWNQSMQNVDAGLLDEYSYSMSHFFTLVYYRDSVVTGLENISLYAFTKQNNISSSLYDGNDELFHSSFPTTEESIRLYTHGLYSGYRADAAYRLVLRYYHENRSYGWTEDSQYVTKAVAGHYSSLDEAASAPDIKEELFNTGYTADFSGEGQKFTVFAEGGFYNLIVKTEETSNSRFSEPFLGSDLYFDITGANSNGSSLTASVVSPYDDTYYSAGYQTAIISDASANLSTLQPRFFLNNSAKAYVGPDEQTSGTSNQDFSNGPVIYNASAPGVDRFYTVTFVKTIASVAQLFVNGPDEREILLNDDYDQHHDVFLANIGTETLTGLNVELDATNVKLDPYWTIGGDGNNSLGAYPYHGAKIRIIPATADDPNFTSDGAVSGTLRISSSNGGSREISLTGLVNRPTISSKYYSPGFVNVLYTDWIESKDLGQSRVAYNLASGSSLPDGLTLSSAGRISGTPTTPGSYSFNVNAEFTTDYGTAFATDSAAISITISGSDNSSSENDNPAITTTSLERAVQYVPYLSTIRTSAPDTTNTVFSVSGNFPAGLELDPATGDIFGVPTGVGTHTFSITATFENSDGSVSSSASQSFSLAIQDNLDNTVESASDTGYEFIEPEPEEVLPELNGTITTIEDHLLLSRGEYTEFENLYIDGRRQVRNVDYTAEDGSTKIVVAGQTIARVGEGTHTISAEFKTTDTATGNRTLKRAAMNYTLDLGGNSGSGAGGNISEGSYVAVSNNASSYASAPLSTTLAATVRGTTATVVFSARLLREAGSANKDITATSSIGNFVLDAVAVKAIGGTADVTATYSVIKEPTGAINVSATLKSRGNEIRTFGKGVITISIPYTLPAGVLWTQIVPYWSSNGILELVMGGFNVATSTVDIYLRHLSDYVIKVSDKKYQLQSGWHDESLDWAVQRGLLDSLIVDGQIDASKTVSRENFIVSLLKALSIQPLDSFTVNQFSDVSGESATYIRTARELGIVSGVGGNRFDPNSASNRGEQFQIVYNLIKANYSIASNQNTNKKISDFKDANAVPQWLNPALTELLKLGVVQGDGSNLNVSDKFTVGEICVVLRNMATPKAAV